MTVFGDRAFKGIIKLHGVEAGPGGGVVQYNWCLVGRGRDTIAQSYSVSLCSHIGQRPCKHIVRR